MILLRLYAEEMRALPRARFALAGAATLAALLTFLAAAMAAGPDGLVGFSIVAFAIAPTLFAGFAAAQMSGLRTSRFTHSLYTAPVRPADVLAAKVLVALSVGALYLLATLPFYAVAAMHLDLPEDVRVFMTMGAGLVVFGTALGTLLGVLFTGRSSVAPVALSVAFLGLSVFAVPYAAALQAQPGGPSDATMRMLHLSPHLLLADATGLTLLDGGFAPASPAWAGILFALETAALLALAAWAYLREQGVEGWEAPPARRALVVGLVALTLLAPLVAADVDYVAQTGEDPHGKMAWADGRNGTVLLVRPGTPARDLAFGDFFAGTHDDPLDAGRANARDVLVLLRLPEGTPLMDVRATLTGRDGLRIEAERDLGDIPMPETGRDGIPAALGGGHVGPVVRIPASLTPEDPRELGGNWYSGHLALTYRLANETEPRTVTFDFPLRADVPDARLHMALAGLPLVLVPATAAVARRIRTG